MKKISLCDAYILFNKYKHTNAIGASIMLLETKVEKELKFQVKLYAAIKAAERASGIDLLKVEIDIIEIFYLPYYNPKISSLYYKEDISKDVISIISDKHKEYTEELKALKELISEKSKDIYLEVDYGPIA